VFPLLSGDLKQIKFLLRGEIGMATIEKITDGRDLIQILEKREYFTRSLSVTCSSSVFFIKPDRHNIAEILLKVAINTIHPNQTIMKRNIKYR
jgi:hypothetical protein